MKAKVTITAEYEIPDDHLEEAYGTTDPTLCVAIDAQNEPAQMLEYCENIEMKIEVVPAPGTHVPDRSSVLTLTRVGLVFGAVPCAIHHVWWAAITLWVLAVFNLGYWSSQ